MQRSTRFESNCLKVPVCPLLRALHAVPSASATDDFYSEFAVRGLPFRHVGLVVDGVPTKDVMHSVHGVSDGGSIAMVNTDALASTSLMPGYPHRALEGG